MDIRLTWGNNSGFGQNNVMALCIKNQEPKGSAWKLCVNLSVICVRMYEKEPAAMSPHVEEMARLVIAEGGSTYHVNNVMQFHLKHKKG